LKAFIDKWRTIAGEACPESSLYLFLEGAIAIAGICGNSDYSERNLKIML